MSPDNEPVGDEAADIRSEARVVRELSGQRRIFRCVVGHTHGKGWRLDKYLHAVLPTLSRALLRRWLDAGWVTIAGQVVDARHRVKPGEQVVVDTPVPPPEPGSEPPPLRVLAEGVGWLVAAKPAGVLPHQAGRRLSGTLLNQVQDWYVARGGDPGEVRLVNRIDRDTSGIVLISLDAATHAPLAAALLDHRLRKEYRAICHGVPSEEHGHWRDPILEASEDSIAMRIDASGKPSHTEYRVLEPAPGGFALLEVLLHTGRQHQIRIHAAHHGHPLVGDWVYGTPCAELAGQALHAAILEFPDPQRGTTIRVEDPLPTALRDLWQRLAAGTGVTATELSDDQRSRLGQADEFAQRLPDWLSDDERTRIAAELGRSPLRK